MESYQSDFFEIASSIKLDLNSKNFNFSILKNSKIFDYSEK